MAVEFGPFVLLGAPETLLHEEVGPDKINNDATDGIFNKQVTLMVPFTRSVVETAMALDAEHDTVIVEHEIGVVARKNVPGAADVADISSRKGGPALVLKRNCRAADRLSTSSRPRGWSRAAL